MMLARLFKWEIMDISYAQCVSATAEAICYTINKRQYGLNNDWLAGFISRDQFSSDGILFHHYISKFSIRRGHGISTPFYPVSIFVMPC